MISLNDISLKIKNKKIFSGVSFCILPSSITCIKGNNGSGKTSLLRMISGIQKPSSGNITHSKDAHPLDTLALPYCTYIGHKLALKQELTILENIEYYATLYKSQLLIPAAIKYFALEDVLYKKCYELSAGNQKKVALTRLLLCPTKLWLLDEIDTNLDEHNKQKLNNLLTTHINNGGALIYTSHSLKPLENSIQINLEGYS